MPLQNRVDPFGNIHAVTFKGTCLGNRGILHDNNKKLRYYHKHKAWIICRLAFKNRKRNLMTPGNYTELFFLDEATALAAGHRPCAECNRRRYQEFARLWQQANPQHRTEGIDDVLHRERFVPYQKNWQQKKRIHQMPITHLPSGTFIVLKLSANAIPYLVLNDALYPWSFAGYGQPIARPTGQTVHVLTPPSTVSTLAQGYHPQLHQTATK